MTLNWVGHPQVIGALAAVGLRGTYCVQQIGAAWWLQGRGHDGLTMGPLPAEGKPFAQLTDAQHYALQLDRSEPNRLLHPSHLQCGTATHPNHPGARSHG